MFAHLKTLNRRIASILAALFVLMGAACDDDPAEVSGPIDIELDFLAQVNGAPFSCGSSYPGVGTAQTTITPVDFRFYVHNVRLVTDSGTDVPVELTDDGQWQRDGVALLDFENGSGPCLNGTEATNMAVRGTVPAGNYTGVKFTLGVPFDQNHQDQSVANPPLDLSGMFWVWNAGYKFLRIDHTSDARPEGWNVHLGSTACTPNDQGPTTPPTSCANQNRPEIFLTAFDHETNQVAADYGRLLAGSDLSANTADTPKGCMAFPGDADCPPVMNRLGLSYGGSNSSGQTFFSKN